ncbi:hypothetical protein HPB49_004454 [Dermacentor silvarum]|uniref:Uncharacterized protein n=1 Tax=Dermacentor silvarum TaxID=543639 RepID=A0ACB8D2K0_DERSI|nr:hypothetical protein HPB49_004454 [Dermacentor silvarum]
MNAPPLLAMGRSIGDRADDQDRKRVIGEAVDCVLKHAPRKNSGTAPLKKVVTCVKKDALQVIQADKEGGFVVLPETLMKEKSRYAVVKNFKEISFEPKKQKKVALKILKDMHLNSLRQLVNTADAEFLEVFFTCKTHKPDHPLRVIVSEKTSWQCHLGKFLQTHLKKLPLKDPFLPVPPFNNVFSVDEADDGIGQLPLWICPTPTTHEC